MRDYPVIVTVGTLERDALAAGARAPADAIRAAAVLLTILVVTGCTVGILLLARNERVEPDACASRRRCSTRRRTPSWSPIWSAG